MAAESDLSSVLAEYPPEYRPYRVEELGSAGGFSGARFWRLHSPAGLLCLRRWPKEHPNLERLQFIQAALWHVTLEGFDWVPLPRETRNQAGFVRYGGYFWEISPWLRGKADFRENPTIERLRAAMEALARFHRAAESFPVPDPQPGASPGIQDRLERLQKWVAGDLADLIPSVRHDLWPELEKRVAKILQLTPLAAGDVLTALSRASRAAVPLQVCIGDIWHDHVLYLGNRVSGLVDFGSMRIDTVSADLARLLGSMAGDDPALWREGIGAYQTIRALASAEQGLLEAFDRSNVLMSGLNWIDWIYRQRRQFESRQAIPGRLDDIVLRLEHLARSGTLPEW
ncbi:MAG: phosphotransferase [Pirellulales bacterium]|nr:phosphotransferase [Pirellulales bacterium]